MRIFARLAVASALLAASLAPALAAGVSRSSPVGAWQSADGQAQVRVTMCGDGTALCAKLVSLSGDARTPGNLKLLNTLVVDRAVMADRNVWQGTVHFNGQTAVGHITLVSARTITVNGCQLGMCKTLQFNRVSGRVAASSITEASAELPARQVSLAVPE